MIVSTRADPAAILAASSGSGVNTSDMSGGVSGRPRDEKIQRLHLHEGLFLTAPSA
ncbi:MAG: hypothetical protein ABJK15_11945 [Lentilitoribacter sp.]